MEAEGIEWNNKKNDCPTICIYENEKNVLKNIEEYSNKTHDYIKPNGKVSYSKNFRSHILMCHVYFYRIEF